MHMGKAHVPLLTSPCPFPALNRAPALALALARNPACARARNQISMLYVKLVVLSFNKFGHAYGERQVYRSIPNARKIKLDKLHMR